MLELDYEELVGEFQAHARCLIAFCGLSWDDRYLRFHEAPGAVQAVGAVQVRQPLLRSSVGHARACEAQLAPLWVILEAEP